MVNICTSPQIPLILRMDKIMINPLFFFYADGIDIKHFLKYIFIINVLNVLFLYNTEMICQALDFTGYIIYSKKFKDTY